MEVALDNGALFGRILGGIDLRANLGQEIGRVMYVKPRSFEKYSIVYTFDNTLNIFSDMYLTKKNVYFFVAECPKPTAD